MCPGGLGDKKVALILLNSTLKWSCFDLDQLHFTGVTWTLLTAKWGKRQNRQVSGLFYSFNNTTLILYKYEHITLCCTWEMDDIKCIVICGKQGYKLTLRACIETWGTLWLTLFMITLKLSFALKETIHYMQELSLLAMRAVWRRTLSEHTDTSASWNNSEIWIFNTVSLPIRGCYNLVADVQ